MEIRRVKKNEWRKLQAFNALEYGPNHILANKVYYDWQFSNVFNDSRRDYTTLGVFSKSGEIVGTLGLFNLPYDFYGRMLVANSLANLIVRKDFRNLGYGFLLLEQASSFNDLAIDHTINSRAMPLFVRSGWRAADAKRFIHVIDVENTARLLGIRASSILPGDVEKRGDNTAGLSFGLIKKFDSAVDLFWDSVRRYYPITVRRSSEYLNWRYGRHPLTKYCVFLAKSGSHIHALAVLRFEHPRDEDGLVGLKVGRIIDLVSKPEVAGFVLRKITSYCAENGAHFVDFFSNGDFHTEALRGAGFVDVEGTVYSSVPILFSPISAKRTKLNFAVKLINGTLPKNLGYDLNSWYTTKGDGDQDRP